MENVAYDHTLTFGTCARFGSLYNFGVNVYTRLSFLVLPIKFLINEDGDPTTEFKLAIGKKPSMPYLRVLFSVGCTKIYCTCWDKGIKHSPETVKGFSRYLRFYSTASKRVYFLCSTRKEDYIFVRCCF